MKIPPIRKIRSLAQARKFLMTEAHQMKWTPGVGFNRTEYRLACESIAIIKNHISMMWAEEQKQKWRKREEEWKKTMQMSTVQRPTPNVDRISRDEGVYVLPEDDREDPLPEGGGPTGVPIQLPSGPTDHGLNRVTPPTLQ